MGTFEKIADSRAMRVLSEANRDLLYAAAAVVVPGVILGLVVLPHTDAKLELYVAIVGAISAVVAYVFKEANRRTTTHDVFIGDLTQKIFHLLNAQKAAGAAENFNPKPISDFLEGVEFSIAEAYRGRLDDTLRMSTRYVASAYAELAYQKNKNDSEKLIAQEARLAAYLMLKRMFFAVRSIVDYDEKGAVQNLKKHVDIAAKALQHPENEFDLARQFAKSAVHLEELKSK